jgi:Skp family chaperone for outer membrane proteins
MKKKLFVLFFLVALVSCGGVNKQDIAEGCASISSSYIDSQLRKGDWKYDPRFNNIRVELKKRKTLISNKIHRSKEDSKKPYRVCNIRILL